MRRLYRHLAVSDSALARLARGVYRGAVGFSLPAPAVVVRPLLWVFLALRSTYHWIVRVLICEPLFKAYCARHGRRVRTGIFVHWVQGTGELIVGDDVLVDGKSSFTFARRLGGTPSLSIGDGTYVGHNCSFTVATKVVVGRRCLLAGGVRIFDSAGHPLDPAKRLAGLPPEPEDIQPVTIGDNVWIGADAVIFPGVTIGDNSVVGTRSIVTRSVPANTVVAGAPAKVVKELVPPA